MSADATNKIKAGLQDALAFAQGDESRARVTVYDRDITAILAAAIREHLGYRLCWPHEQKQCDAGTRKCVCRTGANDIADHLYRNGLKIVTREPAEISHG